MNAPARALAILLLISLLVAACGGNDDGAKSSKSEKQQEGRGDVIPDEPASGPTDEYEVAKDPVHDSFSVKVPVGWTNTAYGAGQFAESRQVVTSVSPDERTTIFIGDPKLPRYWDPARANPVTVQMAQVVDLMELEPYSPASEYVPAYIQRKFGELPAFELGRTEVNEEFSAKLRQGFVDAGLPAGDIESVNVYFTYGEGDDARTALVSGTTVDGGDFWNATVGGISTAGDVDDYLPMLTTMSQSLKIDSGYTAKLNANHQRTMAQIQASTEAMTRRHQANMQWIQNSAQAHQERMQGLWAQADAGMQAYNDRMASMDSTQRGFLNYVNEESTVANPSGKTFQVDSGYQRYWRNTTDGTYVGGDINFGESQLRELGLNPGSYEELKPVR